MTIEKAIEGYRKTLQEGNLHVYATNSCYDRCAHCYVNAVPENSCKAGYVNKDDLSHFANLLRQGKEKINVGLSGGDPLLHPDVSEMLGYFSKDNLEILTSGFALSKKNTKNRKELLESLAKSNASFLVASPDEPYHSITWDDYSEIRDYIKKKGFSPNKLGYTSENKEKFMKVLSYINPIGLAVKCAEILMNKVSGGEKMPSIIPIGRGKKLPKEQQLLGKRECKAFEDPGSIYVNHKGDIQYCMYSCHDGFMNIKELRGVEDRDTAIEMIIDRLSQNNTFKDMSQHDRCYFSKKIRKEGDLQEK